MCNVYGLFQGRGPSRMRCKFLATLEATLFIFNIIIIIETLTCIVGGKAALLLQLKWGNQELCSWSYKTGQNTKPMFSLYFHATIIIIIIIIIITRRGDSKICFWPGRWCKTKNKGFLWFLLFGSIWIIDFLK